MPNFVRTPAYLAIVLAITFANPASCPALPPTTTLNFDFGDGPAYVGDDGVLSSTGGTFWNRVTAENLNNSSNSGLGGLLPFLDEFGNPTAGEVFSPRPNLFSFPTTAGWKDPSGADSPISALFPIVDAISPAGVLGEKSFLHIFRVQEFEEMIIYFKTPPSPLSPDGFANWMNANDVITPFSNFPIQSHSFSDQSGLSYIQALEVPRSPIVLGAGRIVPISVSNPGFPSIELAAIQIRGAFGLPEPTSVGLLGVGIVCSMTRRRR